MGYICLDCVQALFSPQKHYFQYYISIQYRSCAITPYWSSLNSPSSSTKVLEEGSNQTITDNTDGVDETNERKKSTMLEFQSTSLATTNRKVFVTVSGTLTILVAVFLCCRSLQRKTHPDYGDKQNQKLKHRRQHTKSNNNNNNLVLPTDPEAEGHQRGEMAPLMTNK